MSVRVLSEVWDRSNGGGGELLVLLAIADHANDQGYCYPSIEYLAAKSRLKKRQVIRVLDELIEHGEIEVWKYHFEGKGPLRNGYQVVLGRYAAHRGVEPEDLRTDTRRTTIGRKVPSKLREAILEKFSYRCLGCGSTEDLQIDHIIPWKAGGMTEEGNLQPLCAECNRRKGVRVLDFRGCLIDAQREAVWVSSVTPSQVSPVAPVARAILVKPEPSELNRQDPPVVAPPRNRPGKVDRVAVKDAEYEAASLILGAFNSQAGTRYSSADFIAKIVMRIREHPGLPVEAHEMVIRRALEDPWWRGAASPAVVYGNAALFERCAHDVLTQAPSRGLTPEEIRGMAL